MSLKPAQKTAAAMLALGTPKSRICAALRVQPVEFDRWLDNPAMTQEVDRLISDSYKGVFSSIFETITVQAIEFMAEVMLDPEEKTADRMSAAREIMDRALGRPEQKAKIEGSLLADFISSLDSRRDVTPVLDSEAEFVDELLGEGKDGTIGKRLKDVEETDRS